MNMKGKSQIYFEIFYWKIEEVIIWTNIKKIKKK